MQFWIIRNGESVGPLTMEQLKTLGIDRQTKIWYESLPEWTPAGNTPYADEIFAQEETKNPDIPEPEEIATETTNTEENAVAPEPTTEYTQTTSDGFRDTPPQYNPQDHIGRETPPIYHRPSPSNPYGQSRDPYMDGYLKGLEDAKSIDPDTDMSKCPPTNLVWAILSTIICCQPFGIVAIVYASKVTSLYNRREYLKAKKASDKAMYWSLGSAIAWMVIYPIIAALSLAL